ncbi:MAG: hypothetical protein J6C07_08370 [Lachnospiraceae bacterium]|nr:hypothetical protein [Lachnospiraceae bacterium]
MDEFMETMTVEEFMTAVEYERSLIRKPGEPDSIVEAEPLLDKRFCEDMAQTVQHLLGHQYEVEHVICPKNNGVKLDGLLIKKKGTCVASTFYLGHLYNDFKHGQSTITELSYRMVNAYLQDEEENKRFAGSCANWLDRTYILNHVVYRIVNRAFNEELLKTVPYSPLDNDLVKIFYINALQSDTFTGIMTITDSLMDALGLTLAELEEYSEENTPTLLKPKFRAMDSFLSILCDEYVASEPKSGLWVLTNEKNMYGASAIFYDGLMESISELLDSDLYIIPSSIHEAIISKAPLPMFEDYMRGQIRSINSDANVLSREEVLSNNLYYYKRHSNQISVV